MGSIANRPAVSLGIVIIDFACRTVGVNTNHVDPGRLFVGFLSESSNSESRKIEEAIIEIV